MARCYVVNHHGDGRVALWLKAADGAQEHFVHSDSRYYVPPYVGTRGWIGVELDTGLPWSEIGARVRESWHSCRSSDEAARLRGEGCPGPCCNGKLMT